MVSSETGVFTRHAVQKKYFKSTTGGTVIEPSVHGHQLTSKQEYEVDITTEDAAPGPDPATISCSDSEDPGQLSPSKLCIDSTAATYPICSKETLLNNNTVTDHSISISAPSISKDMLEYPVINCASPRAADIQEKRRFGVQNALLLHSVGEKYILTRNVTVPVVSHDWEVLVKISAIGLNPIDWKGPAYNFSIPSLPSVLGRDFAGTVVQSSPSSSRLMVSDVVLVPSTDYRDTRKAAFQEYAVANWYNCVKIPAGLSTHTGASLGVAYVAAAMALGVCFGLDFTGAAGVPGPNLAHILRTVELSQIPEDVRDECLPSVSASANVQRGDWIAIWGASTTTGYIALQLAKLCGIRVICVADVVRHGARLYEAGADVLVDRVDPERAAKVINGVTGGRLRYGLDMVARDTATILQQTLLAGTHGSNLAHLTGLAGLPKEKDHRIRHHTVPLKVFHSSRAVGEALVKWLESLWETKSLIPPEIIVRRGGLEDINDALAVLRSGVVSAKRIVVDLENQL